MANNSPTIVAASLSDDQLKKSIDSLVTHVDEAMKKMVQSTNNAVGEMEAKLKSLGNLKIDSGGSADGGASKRTKAQNAETDAVEKNVAARDKQIKKNQEVSMSFDQIAAAQQKAIQTQGDSTLKKSFNRQELQQYIDRLRELQAEYIKVNTQEGAGAKSDKIKADMRNLEELIAKYREILRNLDYVNSRQGTIDVKKWVQDLGAVDDRYKKLTRWYTVLEKEDQRRIASEEKANQKRLADLEKEKAAQDKVIKSYQDSVLKAEFGKVMKMPTTNIDEIRAKFERLSTIIANIRELGILSPEKISAADSEVKKLGASIQRYEKFEQERIAAEQKFVIEQAKEVEQTQTLEGRVKGLAQAAREYMKANSDSRWSSSAYGKDLTIYAEGDVRARGLSIEEQIRRQLEAEQQVIQQQVSTAQQLNNERKKYVSPTSYEIRDAANNVIANKLGIKNNQVVNANIYSDSIKRVTAEYKQLQDTISKMDTYERNSPIGRYMIQRMQELERQTQRTRAELSRPISLQAAKGISETTLDDMVYKLRQLQSYKMGLNVKTQVDEMKLVDKEIVSLKKRYDELMSKNQQMIASNTALGRSWNYMKNRLAFYFTVGASTQFIKNLIEVRSQYEMNERALGILINSAERGTQIFNELSQMALVSPYTLIELSTAAKQLTAYDVAAKDVVDTTRRLADMAAAVGIPIERLTYALGQIKAYGYLNSRDARMFANAGIPLVKQLSDYYTELEGRLVSTADVYDRIKKKAIDYNEVMEVINKMTDQGGKFFDFQAKMADTLKVRLANLTLAWNNMLNDMGKESQGVLTWGIGALREMFLHWKQLDSLIKNAAWALGIRTALMFIAYSALKVGAALGVTTKQMALSAVFGERLANVLKTVAATMKTVAMSKWTWISLFAIAAVEATQAIFGVNEAQKALNESIRNGAKDNYNNISKFLEQYKEIRESLYATQKVAIGNIYNPVTRKAEASSYAEQQVGQDIDNNEAKKAWEAIREQIELTVVSSDKYIGNLLSISNMSERVRQGFNLLDDVQVVNAALKELDDDTIKVSKDMSAWWNAYQAPDGLIGNLKDLVDAENELIETYGSVEAAKKGGGKLYTDYEKRELANFRDDLRETTNSIINFIELKGWSGDESKINQVFEQITQKLVLDNQLDPQKAFTLQTEVEEARSKAAKEALLQRINDEKEAYKISHDEQLRQSINADVARYNSWNETNGRSKVEWERFTKWLKEQHISETTAMFRNMDAEDIKSLNFQEGKHAEWVTRMVTQYAKEHKMSYDEAFSYLRSWVRSANQWSVFIPLVISTEDKKSVYDQLGEYDKAIDDADAQIERLAKRINELNAKKKKSKEETQELANAEQELADAQKAKADAEAKGGHGKKEKKDAAAARKAQKAAESELQKALKEELRLVDSVRSSYDKLTKSGVSHFEAIEASTSGFDESVRNINKTLKKYGLELDLSKFAGTRNPRELMEMFQKQVNALVNNPNAKPAEIQDLQIKVQNLGVDVKEFDHKTFTDSLNNELGRLKDEYELAVSLDADPELGSYFANMMGINMDDLPRTVDEYAKRVTEEMNKYLSSTDAGFQLSDLFLSNKSLRALEERVKEGTLNEEVYKKIAAAVQDVRDKKKKDHEETVKEFNSIIKKYGEYQAKIEEVRQTADKERLTFVKTYGGEDEIKQAIQLTTEIGAEKDPTKREELRKQLIALVNQLAGDDSTRLKLRVAIDTQQARGEAGVDFEEFQKSPDWILATGDLSNMTKKAIGGLIESLEEYKKSAKNLDSKQIKQINNALKSLYKQQRQNNPFGVISDAIDQAKENASLFDNKITETKDKIDDYFSRWEDLTEEEKNALGELIDEYDKLVAKKEETGKIDASVVVSGINSAISSAKEAVTMFDELAQAIGGENMNNAAKTLKKVVGVLEKGSQGAQIGSSFGGYGAAIGGIVGMIVGFVTEFKDELSGNAGINSEIQYIKEDIIKLNAIYKKLQDTAENSYGWIAVGAKRAVIANKELQLVEMKRQLMMEESRKEKDKDYEQIENLKSEIVDLELEIKNASADIINDLLGISSVGDAMESMMDGFIEALRSGEDAMAVFDESIDNMIANMVKKMFVSKILQPWFDEQWATIQNDIYSRNKKAQAEYDKVANMTDEEIRAMLAKRLYKESGDKRPWHEVNQSYLDQVTKKMVEDYRKASEDALIKATLPTTEDIRKYAELLRSGQPIVEENMKEVQAFLEELGLMKNTASDKNLSALQQGIQGITEQTAGALEAYMNGVSQQVYLQSSLLTQIAQTIQMFDVDVQTSTLGGILLQLQQSYQIQQSIQSILSGWSTPSGLAVRVEMN